MHSLRELKGNYSKCPVILNGEEILCGSSSATYMNICEIIIIYFLYLYEINSNLCIYIYIYIYIDFIDTLESDLTHESFLPSKSIFPVTSLRQHMFFSVNAPLPVV